MLNFRTAIVMKKNILAVIFAVFSLILLSAYPSAAGSIIKIGDDITVERDQEVNTVIVIGGQATIHGLVENNVFVAGGSIVLSSQSVVRGNVICMGGVIVQGSEARVFGDITEINSASVTNAFSSVLKGEVEGWSLILNIIYICFSAVIFIIAFLIIFLVPRPLVVVSHQIHSRKAKSFFWGFLATLMVTPFLMLLVFSIIGITLIPLVLTLLFVAFILGYVAAGKIIGNFILTKTASNKMRSLAGETILGLITLEIVGWIPYIGWFVKFIALTAGLGGVLLALFGRQEQLPVEKKPVNE
ncbi:MAG: hypothetical protein A4E71_01660 [Smithella sp. PtaU1.Bin162]|nr:MAG: hypothetical protein A4E71_01660 [Smithella sp. PtaU1.Bin162]